MIIKNLYRFSIVILLLLFSNQFYGQENKSSDVHIIINGGLNFGGKISSNNFSYKSGENFQIGFAKSIDDKTSLGLGLGIERLDEDYFYPIFFHLESKIFKNPNFVFLFQTGYSFGRTESKFELVTVELEGGLFMETGRGWIIEINDKIDLMSSLTFKYQFMEKEYKTSTTEFEESEDYMYIMFKIGLIL